VGVEDIGFMQWLPRGGVTLMRFMEANKFNVLKKRKNSYIGLDIYGHRRNALLIELVCLKHFYFRSIHLGTSGCVVF